MDPEELNSCWKGHLALPFAASRDLKFKKKIIRDNPLKKMKKKILKNSRAYKNFQKKIPSLKLFTIEIFKAIVCLCENPI